MIETGPIEIGPDEFRKGTITISLQTWDELNGKLAQAVYVLKFVQNKLGNPADLERASPALIAAYAIRDFLREFR